MTEGVCIQCNYCTTEGFYNTEGDPEGISSGSY